MKYSIKINSPANMTYSLDDLSLFSPWPARLLGLEDFAASEKNKTEIEREFGREKWGNLLQKIQSGNVRSLEEANLLFNPIKDTLISRNNKFELQTFNHAAALFRQLVSKICSRFSHPSAVAELGAGYGSVILHLAKENRDQNISFFAGEITESGRECIARLAEAENLRINIGHCDFNDEQVTGLQIPSDSIIFTSYSLHYIQSIPLSFINFLVKINPRAVILFEPCTDLNDTGVYSLLRKKYMLANNYNLDILSSLRKYEAAGLIRINEVMPAVFGTNPLLPASVITFTTSQHA